MRPKEVTAEARLSRWCLPVVLVLAGLPRLGLAWFEHGVNHPDEIFQTLEPAHRWVYRFGIQSWEFQDGARSWLLPGLLALLWKGLAWLGLSDPLTVVPLLRMPFVGLAVYGVYLTWRLACSMGGDRAGLWAAVLAAFAPLALMLDFRCTTEAASAPVVVLALLAVADGKLARAGAWLALLVFLRPTNAVVGLTAAAWLLFDGRFRDTGRLVLGALPVAVVGGVLDWVTWGGPFHHLIEFVRFNWLESGADVFGVQGPWTYVRLLLVTAPLLALLLLPATFALIRKVAVAKAPLAVAWGYLAFLSAVGHKEARFLLPVVPLLAALTAAGLASLIGPWLARHAAAGHARSTPDWLVTIGAAAVASWGLLGARQLTYADLHDARGEPQDRVLFGKRDSVNRLLVEAGHQPDLCGMLILGLMPNELFTGGTTYLNRDVLLVSPSSRPAWAFFSQAANYAVAPIAATPPGWHRVAQRDGVALLARPDGCVAVPEDMRPRYSRPKLSASRPIGPR
jgi:GPI mannosyltransferase 3